MAHQWYFKVGDYEIPPPDKLSYELYPQSDLIRVASYDKTGLFTGTAEKINSSYDNLLQCDRQ